MRVRSALLFLLPSERQYIEVLELRGLREICPLSLSSTLSSAATLCTGLTREGETKVGTNNNTFASDGVKAEWKIDDDRPIQSASTSCIELNWCNASVGRCLSCSDDNSTNIQGEKSGRRGGKMTNYFWRYHATVENSRQREVSINGIVYMTINKFNYYHFLTKTTTTP